LTGCFEYLIEHFGAIKSGELPWVGEELLLTAWSRILLEMPTASQQVKKSPAFLWNPKIHCRIYNSPLPVSITSHIDPVHAHFLNIHLHIILPSTPRSSKWSLSLRYPHHNHVYASTVSIHATFPAHLIFLDLITRTILGEEYKSIPLLPRPA